MQLQKDTHNHQWPLGVRLKVLSQLLFESSRTTPFTIRVFYIDYIVAFVAFLIMKSQHSTLYIGL